MKYIYLFYSARKKFKTFLAPPNFPPLSPLFLYFLTFSFPLSLFTPPPPNSPPISPRPLVGERWGGAVKPRKREGKGSLRYLPPLPPGFSLGGDGGRESGAEHLIVVYHVNFGSI